jgi:hypothetical protein
MISNLLLLALPLALAYLYSALWHKRFKQFADLPQLKPSFLWGHLKALHEFTLKATPGIHHDVVLGNVAKALGNPPLVFFDLWPVSYPMVVITSHEVAEQISRVSKTFPWSTPKSPSMRGLVSLVGPESIITKQVGFCSVLHYFSSTYSLLSTDDNVSTRIGSNSASASTRALPRSIS